MKYDINNLTHRQCEILMDALGFYVEVGFGKLDVIAKLINKGMFPKGTTDIDRLIGVLDPCHYLSILLTGKEMKDVQGAWDMADRAGLPPWHSVRPNSKPSEFDLAFNFSYAIRHAFLVKSSDLCANSSEFYAITKLTEDRFEVAMHALEYYAETGTGRISWIADIARHGLLSKWNEDPYTPAEIKAIEGFCSCIEHHLFAPSAGKIDIYNRNVHSHFKVAHDMYWVMLNAHIAMEINSLPKEQKRSEAITLMDELRKRLAPLPHPWDIAQTRKTITVFEKVKKEIAEGKLGQDLDESFIKKIQVWSRLASQVAGAERVGDHMTIEPHYKTEEQWPGN